MSRHTPSLIGTALLLAACTGDSTSDVAGPETGASSPLVAAQATGASGHATGSAFVTLSDGSSERITFAAIRHTDGGVSGQFEIFTSQLGGVRLQGPITCLGIDGATARLGGLVTRSSPTGFEGPLLWAVVDNGEGAHAAPDQISDPSVQAPPEVVAEFCATGFEVPLLPSERGNIQVH